MKRWRLWYGWWTQRRPPYVTRWSWYVEPWATTLRWRLTGRCLSCGLPDGLHKLQCGRRA